jgi:hypothetical protein
MLLKKPCIRSPGGQIFVVPEVGRTCPWRSKFYWHEFYLSKGAVDAVMFYSVVIIHL